MGEVTQDQREYAKLVATNEQFLALLNEHHGDKGEEEPEASSGEVAEAPELDGQALPTPIFIGSRNPYSMAGVMHLVCTAYNLSRQEICSANRTQYLVNARHVAFWLCRAVLKKSYPEIARFVGGRDHTTIMHAVRKIERQRAEDPQFASDLDDLAACLIRREVA